MTPPDQNQGDAQDTADGSGSEAQQGQAEGAKEPEPVAGEPRFPYIGEIVTCILPDGQFTNGSPEHPAIVTAVHDDELVNLQVFLDCNPVIALGSVKSATDEPSEVHTWRFA